MKEKSRSDENWHILVKMCPLENDLNQMFQGCDRESVARNFQTW